MEFCVKTLFMKKLLPFLMLISLASHAGLPAETELDAVFGWQRVRCGLVIVDEEEAGLTVTADGPAQGLSIVESRGEGVGQGHRHPGEVLTHLSKEKMLLAKAMIRLTELPMFAQWGLEVVAHDGKIIGVVRGLGFLQARQLA